MGPAKIARSTWGDRRLTVLTARIMEPDGYLVLGAAETVVGLTDSFKPLPDRRGIYAPNVAAKARPAHESKPGLRLATAARR